MATIQGFLKNTNTAISSLDGDVNLAIKLTEFELLELNREDQLFKGFDTDGNTIGVYSKFTAGLTKGKSGKGFPKDAGKPYNFYDTGDSYKGLKADLLGGFKVALSSTGKNADLIQKRAKGKAYGLTLENKVKYNQQILLPSLRAIIKRHYRI